ncbi:HlyC/CorC family transporter [bacterium]|nr:HlyC/CorC family transporter [bacterium]
MFDVISIIIIVLGLVFTAFFAGSESAFVIAGRNPIVFLSSERKKYKWVIWWLTFPMKMLSTTLVGTNISIIISTAFATNIFIKYFGKLGDFLSVVVISIISLIFCEIIPKSIAYQNPYTFAEKSAHPLYLSLNIFKPLITAASFISEKMVAQIEELITPHSPLGWQEIETISKKGEVNLSSDKQEILVNLFDFRKMTAFDIMDPVNEISTIELGATLSDVLELYRQKPLDTIPVSKENDDNIIGILEIKDLLTEFPETQINSFIKPALYFPENIRLTTLYNEMTLKDCSLSILIDEYGETSGVMYIRDLVNNFIGKVTPEDKEKIDHLIITIEDGYMIDGSVEIEVINDLLGFELPLGKFKTVAGFLIEEGGGFPDWDEIITYHGWNFQVVSKDSKKIRKIKIFKEENNIQ